MAGSDPKRRVNTELGLRAALRESIDKVTVYAAGDGLYLRRRPNGASSWFFVSTRQGKRRELGLGPYPRVGLSDARAEARDLANAIYDGRDPFAERAAAKGVSPAADRSTEIPLFGDWADDYFRGIEITFKNAVHRRQWKYTFEVECRALRAKRVDEIQTQDVVEVLEPIWSIKNETASRVRGRIERVLDAAAVKGYRDPDKKNPAAWKGHLEHLLHRRLKKSQRGHHRAVPWEKIPQFWQMLAARANSTSVQALRFTILTVARTGETIGAKKREFDLDERKWVVPAERMKMGVEHWVPLSEPALAIIRSMIDGLGPDDYVFPGLKANSGLSNMAMLMLLRNDMKRPETVHGFRSTFRDWAGDATDYDSEIAEMALAHSVGDETQRAYRRAKAFNKRRPLMEDWARYLQSNG